MLGHRPPRVCVERGIPVNLTKDPVTKELNPFSVQIYEGYEIVGQATYYRMDKRSAKKIFDRGGEVLAFWSGFHPKSLETAYDYGGCFDLDLTYEFERQIRLIENHRSECKYKGSHLQYWVKQEYLNHVDHNELLPGQYHRSFDEKEFNENFDDLWDNRNANEDELIEDFDLPFSW